MSECSVCETRIFISSGPHNIPRGNLIMHGIKITNLDSHSHSGWRLENACTVQYNRTLLINAIVILESLLCDTKMIWIMPWCGLFDDYIYIQMQKITLTSHMHTTTKYKKMQSSHAHNWVKSEKFTRILMVYVYMRRKHKLKLS